MKVNRNYRETGAESVRVDLLAVLVGAAVVLGPASGISWRAGEGEATATAVGNDVAEPAKPGNKLDFTLKNMDGRVVKLSQWRGHPVVVDFWASWCAPCREQIPELNELYARYHQSQGLVVIGVACDTIQGDGVKAIRPFVKKNGMRYPILIADRRLIEDLRVESVPTTFFVGRDGVIVARVRGAGPAGTLAHEIRALIGNGTREPKQALHSGAD